MSEARGILGFWFEDCSPEQWFNKDPAFDQLIRDRFAGTYSAGLAGRFDHWEGDILSGVALVILLDQFPRNMFRGTARMYEADRKALPLAKRLIASHDQASLSVDQRKFLYLPLEHSENLDDQHTCLALMRTLDEPRSEEAALRHLYIIERFGRFPHRNEILARRSSPEELAFLDEPNSSF